MASWMIACVDEPNVRVGEYGMSVGLVGVAGSKELAVNLQNDIQGHIRSDANQAPTSLNRRIQEAEVGDVCGSTKQARTGPAKPTRGDEGGS